MSFRIAESSDIPVAPCEGPPAREHLVEHGAEREDVRARVHGAALGLLGRHVGGRAEEHAPPRSRAGTLCVGAHRVDPDGSRTGTSLARPKSSTLTWPDSVIITFAGLTSRWTMPAAWAAARPRATSTAMRSASGTARRPARQPLPQALALHALHRDPGAPLGVLADVVDRDDVGVVQGRGGSRFLQEAPGALGIGHHLGAQQLDGHRSPEARVAGAVEHAHAAFAELARDLEAAERLASQAGTFRIRRWQRTSTRAPREVAISM